MSNIFKSNNRFSSLVEDNSETVVKNKKQQNEIINNKYEKYNNKNIKNDFKNEKSKVIKEYNIAIDSFPILNSKVTILESNKNNKPMNFLEKMKTNIVSENNELYHDIEYENLTPGCLLIKKDPLTNKIINKYKKGSNINEKYLEKEFTDNIQVINSLVDLYHKRTNDFIELWGYDEWEKEFRFPNHDYEYFDKLDELYEEELLEEDLLEKEITNEQTY